MSAPQSQRLLHWLRAEALPFWGKTGWDAKNGGFHERFFFDKTPDTLAIRRTRVQWRQIYVLAHAYTLGWVDDLKPALKGLEYLIENAWSPDGAPGFVQALTPMGEVADATRDAYDHAFAILALTWLAHASRDAQVEALLTRVLAFCDADLTDAEGFLLEAIPPALPRRQNPHMHMLEAMLALIETLDYPGARTRAARFRAMLETRFIDPETGFLLEFFSKDWQPIPAQGAKSIEPGHMAEWCWLIRKYERLCGAEPSSVPTAFFSAARRFAEPQFGFLPDEADTRFTLRKGSRRLWPQTEWIKAELARFGSGEAGAGQAAEAAIKAMLETYLSGPYPGGWYDIYDASGKVAIDTVPTSTLYHIFVCATEAHRLHSAG